MKYEKILFIGFLATIVLISGCTGPSEKNTSVGVSTVDISGYAFIPATIVVPNGTTVVWTNKDSTPHTITGNDFDSGSISQGQAFSHTFKETGTFEYHCKIHPNTPNMKGNVIVTNVNS